MTEDGGGELDQLRARVRELETVDLRVEYVHAMASQLRAQADAIVNSWTWRILSGGGGIWQRAIRRLRLREEGRGISPESYHKWLAACDVRQIASWDGGPRLSVVTQDAATLRSLQAQPYKNWEIAGTPAGARGDYVLLPGAGDEFAADALSLFAHAAAEGADLIYCDEDRLDERGLRVDPWFKPDWSPDLFAATDYIGHAIAVRRETACGSMEEMCAKAANILHIPRVLLHRRTGNGAAARRVRYVISPGARVDILVPSRSARLLARCLRSLRQTTAWRDYSITVIDNSDGNEIAHLAKAEGARHVDWRRRPFNYAAMNNEAAKSSAASLLLFLNDDTTFTDPGWLDAMLEHAARPEVGVVGARLLYPDGRIQHAGVTIGIFGVCGHVFKGWPGNIPTYRHLAETVRNVAAVTGACMLIPARVFHQAGGFDPCSFPVAYNDIDLCLRILETGKRIVYTPYATLYHHEAFSKSRRQREPDMQEIRAFQARWKKYIDADPFYNPNLTRMDETCGLRSREEWI